jgi:hypothetical protein
LIVLAKTYNAMTELEDEPYKTLPLIGAHDIGVNHALIIIVEPHEGHEHD